MSEPIAYDGFGAPLYPWQVADHLTPQARAALAEVRARLEEDTE